MARTLRVLVTVHVLLIALVAALIAEIVLLRNDIAAVTDRPQARDWATTGRRAVASQDAAPPPAFQSNEQFYLRAIAQAAVKTPQEAVKLTPIDATAPAVGFAHLGRYALSENGRLRSDAWVVLPDELQRACRGKPDPLLALEQVLGVPPYRDEAERQAMKVYRFSAAPAQVFRPCVSSPDITSDRCDFDHIVGDPALSGFVFKQIWQSYRSGFSSIGYPFTGMGWSYNWDPVSRDHVGLSEYVVRKDAPIQDEISLGPSDFCKAE